MGREQIKERVFERRMIWELALVRMQMDRITLSEALTRAVEEMMEWQLDQNVRFRMPLGVGDSRRTRVTVNAMVDLTIPLREGAEEDEAHETAHDFSALPFVVVERHWPESAPPLRRGALRRR